VQCPQLLAHFVNVSRREPHKIARQFTGGTAVCTERRATEGRLKSSIGTIEIPTGRKGRDKGGATCSCEGQNPSQAKTGPEWTTRAKNAARASKAVMRSTRDAGVRLQSMAWK